MHRRYIERITQTRQRFLFCLIGRIDVGEIQHLLRQLGVEVTMEQASRILQRYSECVCVCSLPLSLEHGCCVWDPEKTRSSLPALKTYILYFLKPASFVVSEGLEAFKDHTYPLLTVWNSVHDAYRSISF